MKNHIYLVLLFGSLSFLAACGSQRSINIAKPNTASQPPSPTKGTFKVGNPYKIKGRWYRPRETYDHVETGMASWYGPNFDGGPTANGEIFDRYELTAAHRTLQLPSLIRVTNRRNGKSIILRVNDRGPFAHNRVLDVSERAAELLGFKNQGTTEVKIEVLGDQSREIATAARRGVDTSGVEISMNENQARPQYTSRKNSRNDRQTPPDPLKGPPPSVTTAEAAQLSEEEEKLAFASEVPGTVKGGRFVPDPVVMDRNTSAQTIYVQAGSFGNKNNADMLSNELGSIAPVNVTPVNVDGQSFHRVRLGPFRDMARAKSTLSRVAARGQGSAVIVMD